MESTNEGEERDRKRGREKERKGDREREVEDGGCLSGAGGLKWVEF